MHAKFFEEGQLLDLGKDENDNAGNADDIAQEGIDVCKWDKRTGLCMVQEEHTLKVL